MKATQGVGPEGATEPAEGSGSEANASPALNLDGLLRRVGARSSDEVATAGVMERFGIVALWVVMIVVFSILKPQLFPTAANFQTIFGTQAVMLITTLGLLFPLIVGEFDLSVAATMGFAAVLVAVLDTHVHMPILVAVVVTVGAAAAIGAVNGCLVVLARVPSFIATLATSTVLGGLSYAISGSDTVGGVSRSLVHVVSHPIFGLPLVFYYAIAFCLFVWYLIEHTPVGRHMQFLGANGEVARLTGLRVARIRGASLVACAVVAGCAGVFQSGMIGAADPGAGPSYLLPAFSGAFLGATAIRPGRFNAWGTAVAVFFLATGVTGLELLGLKDWVQDVFYGISLLFAVLISAVAQRRRELRAG